MKTLKRVIAVISIIILALVIGYLIYTGGRLTDVQSDILSIIGGML